MIEQKKTIKKVEFDSKISTYLFWRNIGFMILFVGTIPFIPLWVLGSGQWYSKKTPQMMSCILTDKSVEIKSGIFFRKEVNIPLDKITDVTVKQGPLMRMFDINRLIFETAGQSNGKLPEGSVLGIINSKEFRNLVLTERDKFSSKIQQSKTLDDIYVLLQKIQNKLK